MTADIQIKNLRKTYPGGVEALKGIDLEIGQGQLFALLGPNGAGKSTLIKIMTTLIRKDSGEFSIGGFHPETRFSDVQHLIGVASQENELDPGETVEHLLQFQGRLFGMPKKQAQARADELIQLFQLETERLKKAAVLSGGNKRRLHCALALVHKPRILFLDEPTVGMDPLARSTFWNAVSALNTSGQVTVLLTTQYLEEAEKFASHMALIVDGMIHFSGRVADFKQWVHPDEKLSLEESYLMYVSSLKTTEN